MPVLWELTGEYTISKSLDVQQCLPDNSSLYGEQIIYDRKKPETTIGLRAHGMTLAEWQVWQATMMAPLTEETLTDKLGQAHTGYITSMRAVNISGTTLFDVDVTLRLS